MRQTESLSRGRRYALVLTLAAMLAACTLERPDSAVPTSYDLGPPSAFMRSNPAIGGTVLVAPVRTPAWLDETGIVYRLLYEDSARTQFYAMSKWAAEPGALVTDRLRARLAAVSEGFVTPGYAARSDYTLRVELDDFSQHFDAPDRSRVVLRARTTLLDTDDRKVIAQRVFAVERNAAPNAPGAVKALAETTDVFLEDLVKWVIANAKAAANKGDEKK